MMNTCKKITVINSMMLLPFLIFNGINIIAKPSFHDAMSITPHYVAARAERDPLWRKIIRFYNNTYLTPHKNPMVKIPKVIHHIWLGSPLPEIYKHFRKSWSSLHPAWIHILWTDNSANYNDAAIVITPTSFDDIITLLQQKDLNNKHIVIDINNLSFATLKQFKHSKNFGEQADILRYEILFHCGGLYIDTDFKCLKQFDELNECCIFYAGLDFPDQSFLVFNGLMASKPYHPICKECIDIIRMQSLDRPNIFHNILDRTGPQFLSAIIKKYILKASDTESILLAPVLLFYPYPRYNMDTYKNHSLLEIEKAWIKPDSMAIHFWHISWDPREKKS